VENGTAKQQACKGWCWRQCEETQTSVYTPEFEGLSHIVVSRV